MRKKRVLICNDASFLSTGYGIYGKEILSRLFKSGKFDIAELGCFVDHKNPKNKTVPWKFYPNAVPVEDERTTVYKSSSLNQFGAWRFNRVLADFNPDIVFDIRDYWMYSYQEVSPFRSHFNWVIMPTVDSAPQKTEWKITFTNADIVVPYTEWAKQTLTKECGKTINLFPKVANAGINPDEFYIIKNKNAHKREYFDNHYNVIGTVMRNQRRKLLADLMLMFRKFLDKDNSPKNTILYLHTSYPEENGWDIPSLLIEYGVADKVYFTYQCKGCKKFFPSKFKGVTTTCKHCSKPLAQFASPTNGVDTAQLNEIYNLFDIYLQYAICEGFGMPQVEAGACGLPIAAVDYSAMSEIVRYLNGYPIPCSLFREMETNALRALPDNDYMANTIYKFFTEQTDDSKYKLSKNIRQNCISRYSWDSVYAVWEECFDSIEIDKKKPWNYPEISSTYQSSVSVPSGLSKKEFIEFICNNIINEPYLLNTAPIKTLIKDFRNGSIAKGGSIKPVDHKYVVDILESFINNKNMCEKMRLNKDTIVKEDFIQ